MNDLLALLVQLFFVVVLLIAITIASGGLSLLVSFFWSRILGKEEPRSVKNWKKFLDSVDD